MILPAYLHSLCTVLYISSSYAGVTNRRSAEPQRQNAIVSHVVDQNVAVDTQTPGVLQDVLDAMQAMQDNYFDVFAGTWSDAIDWTATVMATHVSATLASIVEGLDLSFTASCSSALRWENVVNRYYTQIGFFYYGENVFALRNQAFDDMLWVVLGWLENIKFTDMYAHRHYSGKVESAGLWHGSQLIPMAAHRARIFYELASHGWSDTLCDGGMVWNPNLTPYKNAITNELYAAASISMYLYFPGDNNTTPFVSPQATPAFGHAHDPRYLENAVKSYKWLQDSKMQNSRGLYQDGFHVTGWRRFSNGTIDPGSGHCDEINTMVYTYNQGVLLTASRGLWLATGAKSYLEDGHDLINSVLNATGWSSGNRYWHGLGRAGILEEYCDHTLQCSQDGQTFKGIFFHHMAEFCRPLRKQEEDFVVSSSEGNFDQRVYKQHLAKCASYGAWVNHNAEAVLVTRNKAGLYGMWWGASVNSRCDAECQHISQSLPQGAIDYRNTVTDAIWSDTHGDLNDRGRGRTVETQSGALAVLRARWLWHTSLA